MPEKITFYHDALKLSPWCYMVEMALLEAGASYTSCGLDIHNKPAWFAKVNPLTGKVPTMAYGGPNVPPEEPSPLSFTLTESRVILEFLADLFPNSGLLPPASDPTARARVRFFIDVVTRNVEKPLLESGHGGGPEAFDKMIEGLEKVQALLPPHPDAVKGGEYALGKDFTNADCVIAPLLAFCQLACKTGLGRFEPGAELKLKEALEGEKLERLRRYQKTLWERESVKKVIDLERVEGLWRGMFPRN